MYTEDFLNDRGTTKAKLIEIVLELQDAVAATSGGPITSSKLIEKQLKLASDSHKAEVKLAEIATESEEKMEALKISAEAKQAAVLSSILDQHEEIKADIRDFEKASESKIAIMEAESTEKIEDILGNVEKTKESANVTISELAGKILIAEKETSEKVEAINMAHTRKVDEVKYENDKALRDENATFVVKAAEKAGVVLVKSEELAALKDVKEANEDAIKAAVGKAVGIAESTMKRKYEDELKQASFDSQLKINELETVGLAAGTQLKEAKATVTAQAEQIAKIPSMITDAVSAAKSSVNVTQDAGKK